MNIKPQQPTDPLIHPAFLADISLEQDLFDAMGAIAMVMDVQGCIVRMNQVALQFMGVSLADVVGQPYFWERFIPENERPSVHDFFKLIRNRLVPPLYENHWVNRAGEKRLFRWVNRILDDKQGNPAWLVTVGIDISDQRDLLERTRKAEAFNSTLLNNASVGINMLRYPERILEYTNQAMLDIYGVASAQVLLGRSSRDFFYDDETFAKVGELAEVILTHGNGRLRNVLYRRLDSSAVYVDLAGQKLPSMAGEPERIVWTFVDVTERNRLDQQLHLQLSFNAMLAKANEIIAAATSIDVLLKDLCEMARTAMNLPLVWIGQPDTDGYFQPLAASGTVEHLQEIRISILPDHPDGRGASATVWRTGQAVYSPVLAQTATVVSRLESAARYGLKARAALPVRFKGSIWGVLSLYFAEATEFDDILKNVLQSLAANIGFGLDRLDMAEKERQAHAYNDTLLNNATAGIVMVRFPERSIMQVNQAFLHMFGYADEQVMVGKNVRELYVDQKAYDDTGAFARSVIRGENERATLRDVAFRHASGKTIFMDISARRLDGEHDVLVATFVDVTERHHLSEQLARQAMYDALTDLPNRRALGLELEKAMARALRRQRLLAVCLMDLDEFKPVNDTWGHEVGDWVLQTVARRLRANLRSTDFVARLGGDEFVLLLEDCSSMEEISHALRKAGDAVQLPMVLVDETRIQVGLSAGVCLYPLDGENNNPDALLRYADQALYVSKAQKADRHQFWFLCGETVVQQTNAYQNMLNTGGLLVYYQPVLDNASGRIVGVEALARLQDANGTVFAPAEFLSSLNKKDLFELSRQVLLQATTDMAYLESMGYPLWVSVNIDPTSINAQCVSCLQNIIQQQQLPAARIMLEILEGGDFLEDQQTVAHLTALSALGVRLALDDVGSAYSSLLRLKELPIDEIKLGQGFIRTLETDPSGMLFAVTVYDLSCDLAVDMVVEGVETGDIFDAVSVLGVPLLQGYQIAHPMPIDALTIFLHNWKPGDQKQPASLLGLYTKQVNQDRAVRNMLRQKSSDINAEQIADARNCPVFNDMLRLGIAADHPLHTVHQQYHDAISALIHAPKPDNWRNIQQIQNTFLQMILQAYAAHRQAMPDNGG